MQNSNTSFEGNLSTMIKINTHNMTKTKEKIKVLVLLYNDFNHKEQHITEQKKNLNWLKLLVVA